MKSIVDAFGNILSSTYSTFLKEPNSQNSLNDTHAPEFAHNLLACKIQPNVKQWSPLCEYVYTAKTVQICAYICVLRSEMDAVEWAGNMS